MLEPCQVCGDWVEDRAWDAILQLWVGECCHVDNEAQEIQEATSDEVA